MAQPTPEQLEKTKAFLAEVHQVCLKHNLTLMVYNPDDNTGSLVVTEYVERHDEILSATYEEF